MGFGCVIAEDLTATALVAVDVQGALGDPVAQRVAQVFFVEERAVQQRQHRLLVEVLELGEAEVTTVGVAAHVAQLAGLPFPEGLADACSARRTVAWGVAASRPGLCAPGARHILNVHVRLPPESAVTWAVRPDVPQRREPLC